MRLLQWACAAVLAGSLISCAEESQAPAANQPTSEASPSEEPSEDAPSEEPTEEPSTEPSKKPTRKAAPAPKPRGTVVATAGSQFGTVLFDGTGQAIYYFDREKSRRSECYDACAEAWPPVLTEGTPEASGKVRNRLLGTTERDDGTTQVTYDGHPLYYYAHEGKNVVLCHNVPGFGGLWLAVKPGGQPVP